MGGCYAEKAVSVYGIVARSLLKDSPGETDLSDASGATLTAVRQAEEGDITVYSGFSPFVGSGVELGGWSFAVDVERGRSELSMKHTPRPFTLEELYTHVTEALGRLSAVGVLIDDQIYVDGTEIRNDQRFLEHPLTRPRTQSDAALLASVRAGADEHVRHYKRIRVVAWRGQLVLSIFLRFALIRGNLFTEVSRLLLPPLDRRYRQADSVEQAPTLRHRMRLAATALVGTPVLWFMAPIWLFDALAEPYTRWRERRRWQRKVRKNPAFDYGADKSLRELTASKNFDQYFQKLDSEMYQKVLEHQLLASIVEFLDDHDIDTSDLKERENAILNNGVIVTGGSVTAESLAVGQRARATTRRQDGQKGAPK